MGQNKHNDENDGEIGKGKWGLEKVVWGVGIVSIDMVKWIKSEKWEGKERNGECNYDFEIIENTVYGEWYWNVERW